MTGNDAIDWTKANKHDLLTKLLSALSENERLRESVARLMKRESQPCVVRHTGSQDDFVPVGWTDQHCIEIPRADGFFESPTAWVRVTHGVITNAGLKNQSMLAVMISRELLSASAELYAKLYIDWRAAFFARVEATRYSDVGSGDPEAWSKEDRFSKLLKAVERKHLRYVDAIVTSRTTEKHLASLNGDSKPWVEGFERMADAVHRINREADEYLEALRHGPGGQK